MLESFPAFVIPLGTLVAALAVLIFSAGRLVGAAEEIGLSMGIPPFLMGITVLAVGTSLPELVTGLLALYEGNGEIVAGTVMGSNIANILLVLGFTAFYAREMVIDWDLMHGDLPVLFGSVLMIVFVVYPVSAGDQANYRLVMETLGGENPSEISSRSVITVVEGALLVFGYAVYLYYYAFKNPNVAAAEKSAVSAKARIRPKDLAWIVVGLLGVPLGATFTVGAAVEIATLLDVGKGVIAASMIALGTSLPELIVSISAVRKKNFEMALGNVTGSNIFNTFIVLGVPALVAPLMGDKTNLGVGESSILFLQTPYYVATTILFLVIVLDKRLTRTEGLVILVAYGLFFSKLFSWF
ncbi:MAG: calcium/sodium antiporter [bacterium]